MTSLTNLDLVDPTVFESHSNCAEKFRESFGIEGVAKKVNEEFELDFTTITNPIDWIRIGSFKKNSCFPTNLCVSVTSDEAILGYLDERKNIFLSNRSSPIEQPQQQIDKFEIMNKDFLFTVCGLKFALINLSTLTNITTHSLPSENESRQSIVCIEKMDNNANFFRYIVATNDGAIYFITILFGQQGVEINHQLVIASNLATLGKPVLVKKFLDYIAILWEKSMLILQENNATKKPKICIKISDIVAVVGESFIAWFAGGLLVKLRLNNFLILEKFSENFFEQKHCFVRTSEGPVISIDSLYMTTDRVGLIESRSTNTCSLYAFELEPNLNGWILKIFPKLRHEVPDKSILVGDGNKHIYCVSSISGDIHEIKLSGWNEVVNSLVYSEKFFEAIVVMEAIRRKVVYSDTITGSVVEKIINAGNMGKINSNIFLNFMYFQKLFDYEIDERLLDELIGMIVNCDGNHHLDPSLIPSSLFQKIMAKLAKEKCALIDPLIVRTIFFSHNHPRDDVPSFPIDLNNAIRIATIQDLQLSVIMIHVYLLQDFIFPVKYLLDSSSIDELLFYLFSILNGLLYPFWQGKESMYDVAFARAQLRNYLINEGGMVNIWKKISSVETAEKLLNSVLFESEFEQSCVGQTYEEQLDMFRLKSAVITNTVEKYLSGRRNFLQNFLSLKNNFNHPKLFVELFNKIGLPDTHDTAQVEKTLDLLLSAPSMSVGILVKLIDDNFVDPMGLEQLVHHLVDKKRVGVALLILESRRDVFEIVELLTKVEFDREIVDVFKGITERSGELFEMDQLVHLWAKAIASGTVADLDPSDIWLSKVDTFKLVQAIEDVHVMNRLAKGLSEKRDLLNLCSVVYGIDVGTQFNQLVRRKDRCKGFQSMATICHVCLDPLLAKRETSKRICFFTCGHLAHEDCCDIPQKQTETKVLIKCPACV